MKKRKNKCYLGEELPPHPVQILIQDNFAEDRQECAIAVGNHKKDVDIIEECFSGGCQPFLSFMAEVPFFHHHPNNFLNLPGTRWIV